MEEKPKFDPEKPLSEEKKQELARQFMWDELTKEWLDNLTPLVRDWWLSLTPEQQDEVLAEGISPMSMTEIW